MRTIYTYDLKHAQKHSEWLTDAIIFLCLAVVLASCLVAMGVY
jgi:hypothetical protein